jgi:hypothetical protein
LPPVIQPAKPIPVVEPAPVFARYNYFSPRKPQAGDRTASTGAFTKARLFEQEEKWTDALQWYQQSAALDPAWFEAQYNTGVLAHRLCRATKWRSPSKKIPPMPATIFPSLSKPPAMPWMRQNS